MSSKFSALREKNNNTGFTLLEVMISVALFGLIMLYVSQILNQEIRLYNNASKQNNLQNNTRAAMMHIIDELRFHHSKKISDPSRVFGSETVGEETIQYCIICTDPSNQMVIDPLTGIYSFPDDDPDPEINPDYPTPIIYFDEINQKLWYQKDNQKKLIADKIQSLKFSRATGILTINLEAEDLSINKLFKLTTSIRLL